jgi:putative thioredoxin
MLIGGKKEQKQAVAPTGDIFDVTTADFENVVLKMSMDTPVLVDFWAPWCGPCKQLGPMLEAAVTAAGGKVKMAKINVDENPDLAQAMRVQSIPTVYAFFQGQPVTAFSGARSQAEIKSLIDQLVKLSAQAQPERLNVAEMLPVAAKALADGDIASAQAIYAQVLGQDENNVQAHIGLVRSFIASGDLEQARDLIEDAPEAVVNDPQFSAAKTALDLAENAPGAGDLKKLAAAAEKKPDDHQARFDYALALFGAGQRAEAIDQLLDIMRRDRGNEKKWEEDKARLQILKFFEAMGPSDPETLSGRRKLSSLLFS